jgi:predicted GIY-YIG superfamily endonuclease
MPNYYVYVLRSLSDQQFYVGLTDNLPKRLQEHDAGRATSTKRRAIRTFVLGRLHEPERRCTTREVPQDRVGQALSESETAEISHEVNEQLRSWWVAH